MIKTLFIKLRDSLVYDAFAGIGIGYWFHAVISHLIGVHYQ